jgi:dethiobiotin synthetase
MIQGRILFITGTDTDVGKTVVSLLVMHLLAGRDAVYLKPVQTGCLHPDHDSDAAFVHRHLPAGLPRGMKPGDCIHSCRLLPKAPLFAGDAVDFAALEGFITGHAKRRKIVVVEGAGGILVPVTAERTMLDLACAVRASILVVGRAGLGTINHTLLTLEAIKARKAECLGVILTDPASATAELDRRENSAAIESYSGLPVHGVIGQIRDLRNPPRKALSVVECVLSPLLSRPVLDHNHS